MKRLYLTTSALAFVLSAGAAHAQDAGAADEQSSDSFRADIVVTAQKKSVGEKVQDIPVAITALSEGQLAGLNVRSLADVATLAPNATLDNNGTYRGYANFAMRGGAVNGSVPSVDPAVGLFVNGVYQGIAAGATLDGFDMANIQILRGPQGTLFGRNVTGGAVLIETKRPTGELEGVFQASYETGPEYNIAGAISVPIVEDVLDARIAAYYRNDEGWFRNQFDGSKIGKLETYFVRPTIVFHPSGPVTQTFIAEFGKNQGDGIIAQGFNQVPNFDKLGRRINKGFRINTNNRGATDQKWFSLTSETVIDVGLGDGVITNVFGYRTFESFASLDADGGPTSLFRIDTNVDQSQLSNELRYAGTFGNLDLTVGTFYFYQDLLMQDARDQVGGARGGGGTQESHSFGLFAQGTYKLTDALSLTAGLRYSYERKKAIASRLTVGRCLDAQVLCNFATAAAVNDSDTWDAISPRVGLDYKINDNILVYASFNQAVRSGGYNLRITAPNDPGKFDQEDLTAYEIGFKSDLFDNHLRLNVTGFINEYKGMQRIVAVTIGTSVIQTIDNAADARISGVEGELVVSPVDGLEFPLSFGYQDAKYTRVRGDLNSDNVVNDIDRNLALPRISKWSASAAAVATHNFGDGSAIQGQLFYAYRSRQAAEDSNSLFFPTRDDVRFNLRYTLPGGRTSVTAYGRNLLNQPGDSSLRVLLPAAVFPSGGIRSLGEGRSFGVLINHEF